MSFPRYASYKPSGVEWLGEVPEHWRVLPIRKAALLTSGHTPSRQRPEYWEDCSVPWFTLGDVWQIREGRQTYVTETGEKISQLGLANSSARLLPKGTVILSRTASVGFSGILGVDMATTQDFANCAAFSDAGHDGGAASEGRRRRGAKARNRGMAGTLGATGSMGI